MDTITRKEAKAKGLIRYFTGIPCKHGHVCERFTNDWKCVECNKAMSNHRYATNEELRNHIVQKQRDHYKNNRQEKLAYSKQYGESEKGISTKKNYSASAYGRAKIMCNGSKARAKKAGLIFEITWEWIEEKLKVGKCEQTGIAFDLRKSDKKWGRRWNAPSLDQKVPGKGYTADNCQVVIIAYNGLKGQATDEEAHKIIEELIQASSMSSV